MPETSSMKDLDSEGGVRLGAEVCRDNTWIANHRFRFAIGHDLPSIHHYEMMAKSPDHAHQVLNHQKCDAISGKVLNGALHDLSLIHISEPTRLGMISYAVFC